LFALAPCGDSGGGERIIALPEQMCYTDHQRSDDKDATRLADGVTMMAVADARQKALDSALADLTKPT
jgi:hypothetical protein